MHERPIVIVDHHPVHHPGFERDGSDRHDGEDDRKATPVKVVKQPLARTGTSSADLSAAGLVLVALGATAVVASRPRRRSASTG